ncbi:MAG: NUDIX domain-containing protein [bacterium]
MNRQVVLVDEQDNELGLAEIYEAHQGKGLKHRALSVILYRKKDGVTEILLQKRAEAKPVFKLLWSNTCCTNLRPRDTYLPRAVSRLQEEMGIEIEEKDLHILYRFSYESPDLVTEGWCENEVDTVIVGEWDPPSYKTPDGRGGEVKVNPEEAADYRWTPWGELQRDINTSPRKYTPWFRQIIRNTELQKEIYG